MAKNGAKIFIERGWKMKLWRFIYAVSLAGLLTGCASQYSEPGKTTAHAVFVFAKTVSKSLRLMDGQPHTASYQTFQAPHCQDPVPVANFTATASKFKTRNFAAGKPVTVVINLLYNTSDNSYPYPTVTRHACVGMAKFIPLESHTYSFSTSRTMHKDVCILNVVDRATAKAPPDLLQDREKICQ